MTSPTRAWLTLVAWLAGVFVFGGAPTPAEAAPPGVEVPPELAPWVSWVKERDIPAGDCREVSGTTICAWPSYLSVQATESGANFQLDVSVFGPTQLGIPGDNEHWPQSVKVDKKAAVVSRVGGVPSIELEKGRHKVSGTIPWRSLPDSLRVPNEMGLIDLRVGGERVAFPSRTEGWLSLERPGDVPEVEPEPESPEEPEVVEPDSEKIEVSRQLVDGVPLSVLTRIDLHVTGAKRELVLPRPMWSDAKVLQISAPVPVKMGEDGSLVLQVRAGTFAVEVRGVLANAPSELAPPKRDAPWPAQEVWVWQAAQPDMPSMGQVSLSGAPAVDRARTHAPAGWAGGATYSVTAERPLKFEIIQRGVSQTAPNELQLNREMRVDMAGGAWTVQDSVYGTMNRGTRLDLERGVLAAATVNGVQQVVTVGETGNAGVEVRDATVSVNAQWRLEDSAATLPLGGWSEDFDRVRLEFMLPRGWDVLHATGPGSLKPTWFEAWRPLDLILLLVVVVLVGRFVHPAAAVAALLGLGFAYTRNGDGYLMLLGLVGTLTVLLVPLARVQHKWTRLGLRLLWASAAFVLSAWVVWRVPQGVTAVWRDGLSALAHVSLERDFESLAELWGMAAVFCGGTLALAWLGARAQKGMGRWVALGLAMLVGLGGLATLFQRAEDGGIAPTSTASNNEMDFESVGERQAELAAAPAKLEEEESENDWDEDRSQGDEGKMGKATSKKKSGLYAMKGPKDAVPEMVRSADEPNDPARSAGILGVMQEQDGFAAGGLGLVGNGRGGGGGEGSIGLGNTGLVGKGGGGSTGSGYGTGSGFGGRGKRVPRVRQGNATVQGSLDKDIVRRIVRAHINEVRACYNTGLAKNENLSGRVDINFVITATGKVGASVVNNQTLGDQSVGLCVAKAVKRWKFPKPQGGGNVVVTYPFVLNPGDGPPPPPGNAPEAERFVATDLILDDLPPPAVPQTGEGEPNWSGTGWTFELDRAVKADEELNLWLLTPTVSKTIALLRALGLIWLAIALLRKGLLVRPDDSSEREEGSRVAKPKTVTATSKAAALVAGLFVWGAATSAQASPPKELLDELAERVNEQRPLSPRPDCGAQCVLVSKLSLDVRDDTLAIAAEVHMAGPGVWQLPGGVEVWIPKSVKVNGKAAAALAVHEDRLLLHLPKGLHRVELSGPVGAEVLDLALPTQPKRVSATMEGWSVSGIDENELAQSLHLERLSPGTEAPVDPMLPEDPKAPEDPPANPEGEGRTAQDQAPWFAVQRSIVVGPRWTVQTRVTRLSHGPSPTKVRVPLLPGEKMLEASAKVDDPKASLTFAAPGQSITWTSVLEQTSALELHAPEDKPWAETWVLTCAGAWQCGQAGTPATQDRGGTSVFNPWPGESLALSFFEPKPAAGELLAVDRAELNIELGETGTQATLSMTVRTATVAERVLELPPLAHVGAVRVDGTDVPVAKDSAQVRLSFQPGGHEVSVEFKLDAGSASVNRAPVVQLGGRAVNARVTFNFSDADERVVVWTSGEGMGPLVWLWPYLLVLVLLALALSRFTSPPLNSLQWFALSLGFSVMALPLVLGWFMLVQWRETKHAELDTALKYNAAQIGLGVITLGVLGLVLLTAKELLTSPMSTIVHNWGDGASLSWYLGRSEAATPAATIVTLPTSLWRAVWALWVVWLGWSSIGWAKWSWGIVGEGEWLRSAPLGGPSAEPEPEPEPEPETEPEPKPEAKPTPPSPSFEAPSSSTTSPADDDDATS